MTLTADDDDIVERGEYPGPWSKRGACKRPGVDPRDFFLEGRFPKGSKPYIEAKKKALAMCASCPVSSDCLDFALRTDQRYGIWGGTTGSGRREMKYAPKAVAS